ncbi:threonine/homoserine/homoserine lactone efflux protein [Microbacterium resistens]|uniref:Threonine/homoserine/homoserine lactone efflux protein n=1 Tax=Microbacterium resistens TaxID=156977 RepID=A0ABU1S810_9MICO|nr:LysE family transporter [Microbacterium resistens]MDR6865751.1 threonine/homoserine/homoserine lactone efflux protein [Microbacterium resistens]
MTELLVLVTTALPFVIAPGSSFTLIIANVPLGRRASWWHISCGTGLGVLVVAIALGATGIGTVLQTRPLARGWLGVGGSIVLIALGAAHILRHRKQQSGNPQRSRGLARWAFLSVLTNPKALSIYVLVVPALSSTRLNGPGLFLVFACIHSLMQGIWLLLVHEGAARIPGIANSARVRSVISIAAGALMVALGLFTAVTSVRQLLQSAA